MIKKLLLLTTALLLLFSTASVNAFSISNATNEEPFVWEEYPYGHELDTPPHIVDDPNTKTKTFPTSEIKQVRTYEKMAITTNVLEGPNDKYDTVIAVKEGTNVGVLEQVNDYYLIEFKKKNVKYRGYIIKSSLKLDSSIKEILMNTAITRNVIVSELGLCTNSTGTTVYSGPSTVYSVTGTLEYREIVLVVESVRGWYYVQYRTPTTYKLGYVTIGNVTMPDYGYHKPIEEGHRRADYPNYSDGSYHGGIDIGAILDGANIYAIDGGTANDQYYCKLVNKVPTYLVGYAQAVNLELNDGRKALYAHLSEWSDGQSTGLPSLMVSYSSLNSSERSIETHRSRSVNNGDYLGITGDTGYSYGPHLHFGMKNSANYDIDPFAYILFPDIDYLNCPNLTN